MDRSRCLAHATPAHGGAVADACAADRVRRGPRARIQARNAQRDLVVVELVSRDAVSQLSVYDGRRWAEGARD